MKKSLKMAHKLMLLIGSVIVVAGVIVLAQQLKSSAQVQCLVQILETACTDGCDNDLDGLVDSRDPDCGGGGGGSCVNLPGSSYSCDKFLTQSECDMFSNDCKWIGGGGNVQCDIKDDRYCLREPMADGSCSCDSAGNICSTSDPDCQGGGGGGGQTCNPEYICYSQSDGICSCTQSAEGPSTTPCSVDPDCQGGGGVDKTCFAIYGRYNPYRAIIPGSLATQDLSELERIKAIAGLDTSAKVDEALRATNLKANIDALYTQDRVREMSAVKAEVTKRISEMPDATYTQMRPIFDGYYVATVSIPMATALDLASKYVGFDLGDPRACDNTNGGGQVQCDTDGTFTCAWRIEDGLCNCCGGVPLEEDFVDCGTQGGGGLSAAGADGETNPRLRLAECVGNPNLCGAVVLDSEIIHRVRLDQIKEDLSRYFAPIEAQMVEIAVAPTENVVANAVDNNVLETAAVVEAVNQAAETAATLILDIPPISAAIDATVQQAITADAASNASEKAVGTIKALNPSVTATEIAAVQAQVTKTVTEVITAKVNAANK